MEQIIANPLFVLFAVLFAGMALGSIQIMSISLGTSGVLFAALVAGYFGLSVPDGITGIGTAIFVYCVGLGVGNRFFSSLRRHGRKQILLSFTFVGVAALLTWLTSTLVGLDSDIAAGLFAGACTSTPAFASATESASSESASTIGTVYAVAYPLGVVCVILFVQILPRLLKQPLDTPATGTISEDDSHVPAGRAIIITNRDVIGLRIDEVEARSTTPLVIVGEINNSLLIPAAAETTLTEGMLVYVECEMGDLDKVTDLLGTAAAPTTHRSFDDEKAELIVMDKSMCDIPLNQLATLKEHGVHIIRVTRLGSTFIPSADTKLERKDIILVMGKPADVKRFRSTYGNRSTSINATDIFSLAGGVMLGILLGSIPFNINGTSFSLGIAGGPMLVALILGHFGKIGPLTGYMPRQGRTLLMDFALMIYLAGAGVVGGSHLMDLLHDNGLVLMQSSILITLCALIATYFVAQKVLKMNLLEALGSICGSMASTPALGVITAKTDKKHPVIAFATAYPAAVIFMIVSAKIIINIM